MTRTEMIQSVIDRKRARSYLEIGVEHGQNFFPIRCARKVAVDPDFEFSKLGRMRWSIVNPCNLMATFFRGTSNDYFDNYKAPRFDVAFIDGLHTFEQTHKDIQNTLERLNEGGVIVVHDCNPPNEAAAEPADTPSRAATLSQPSWSGAWCGDVWKVICLLRSSRTDLKVFVLDGDYGLGIITKGAPESRLDLNEAILREMSYEDLDKDRKSLLDLRPESHLTDFLKAL